MSIQISSAFGTISRIRMFLEADSPTELVRLQLQNNMRFASEFSYTDFMFAKGKFYCWYLIDAEDMLDAKSKPLRESKVK